MGQTTGATAEADSDEDTDLIGYTDYKQHVLHYYSPSWKDCIFSVYDPTHFSSRRSYRSSFGQTSTTESVKSKSYSSQNRWFWFGFSIISHLNDVEIDGEVPLYYRFCKFYTIESFCSCRTVSFRWEIVWKECLPIRASSLMPRNDVPGLVRHEIKQKWPW